MLGFQGDGGMPANIVGRGGQRSRERGDRRGPGRRLLAGVGVEDGRGLADQHVDVHVVRVGVEAPQAVTMSVVQGPVGVPLARAPDPGVSTPSARRANTAAMRPLGMATGASWAASRSNCQAWDPRLV